ncbi:hypothetical protein BsWGS_15810 [Bradybaena similaris]
MKQIPHIERRWPKYTKLENLPTHKQETNVGFLDTHNGILAGGMVFMRCAAILLVWRRQIRGIYNSQVIRSNSIYTLQHLPGETGHKWACLECHDVGNNIITISLCIYGR